MTVIQEDAGKRAFLLLPLKFFTLNTPRHKARANEPNIPLSGSPRSLFP